MRASSSLAIPFLLLGVSAVGSAVAQQTEAAKLVPPWKPCYTCYAAGSSVALSGDWAFVGALGDAVFVYRREPTGWTLSSGLRELEVSSVYPSGLAASDTTLAVGAMWAKSPAGQVGKVYVYELSDSNQWVLTQELQPPGLRHGDNFGTSIALFGDQMVVGAPGLDVPGLPYPNSAGALFFFARRDGNWLLEQRLLFPPDFDLWFNSSGGLGLSVDMTQDVVVAGAPLSIGAAFVYERSPKGWHRSALLRGPAPQLEDAFGAGVAVHDRTIVVGQPAYIGGAIREGKAFVFEKGAQAPDKWGLVQTLEPSDGFAGTDWADEFGNSVDIDRESIVVGSHKGDFKGPLTGTAYLFKRNASGGWPSTESERFVASDAKPTGGSLGIDVAIDRPYVLAGATSAPVDQDRPGAGYVFEVEVGVRFCVPQTKPNSTGQRARMSMTGSETVSDKSLRFSVRKCPPETLGFFLMAPGGDPGTTHALGDGTFCLPSRGVARLRPLVPTGKGGAAFHDLDLDGDLAGKLEPGTTWSFQYLFRDTAGGPAAFNLTSSVALTVQ